MFYEFKRKVFEQHAKFTKLIDNHNKSLPKRNKEASVHQTNRLINDDQTFEEELVVKSSHNNQDLVIKIKSFPNNELPQDSTPTTSHPLNTTNDEAEQNQQSSEDPSNGVDHIESMFHFEEQFLEYIEETANVTNNEPEFVVCDKTNSKKSSQDESEAELMIEEFVEEEFCDLDKLAEYFQCNICSIHHKSAETLRKHVE